MSLFFKARDVLATAEVVSGDFNLFSGMIESELGEFDKADDYLVRGLQLYSEQYAKEEATGYYGDHLPISRITNRKQVDLVSMAPEVRLKFLNGNLTPRMVECIVLLCRGFDHNRQNKLGQQYEMKAKEFLTHIFGCYALIPSNAVILKQIAMHKGLIRGHSDLDFEKRHRNALTMLQKIYGEDADILDVARILRDIGLVYSQKAENQTSIEYRKRSLAMMQNIIGEDSNHLDIVKVKNNLAADYAMLGDYETALGYFHKSLTMKKIFYGPDRAHTDIALMLNNIGTTYEEYGDYENAKKYLQGSLDMVHKLVDDRKPSRFLGAVYSNLGAVCTALGNLAEAEELLNKALLYYESTPEHDGYLRGTAGALGRLTINYLDMERFEDSEKAGLNALKIYNETLAPENIHMDVGEIHHHLANSLRHQTKSEEAEEHFKRALKIYKANSHLPMQRAALLFVMHELYKGQGESEKSKLYLSEAEDTMIQVDIANLRGKE